MRSTVLYILVIAASILLIFGILRLGNRISAPPPAPAAPAAISAPVTAPAAAEPGGWARKLFHNPIALLLIQAMLIIPLARLLGTLFAKINQPMVIGEIIAGLLLGPSFLGWAAPAAYHFLFPENSLMGLNLLSQVGLIFFMFLVGLEFNPDLLKGRTHVAVATSHASIVIPFLLGSVFALYLYPKVSHAGVHFVPFALFMGASMSVTAFPVLARILTERNLVKTKMGAIALTCAAVDDVTAWIILALVISVVRATGPFQILTVMLWTALYLAFMLTVIRPLLRKFERRYSTREGLSQNAVAIVILMLLLSSLTTEVIGIHALFGAFFLGAVMPNETSFVRHLTEKIEDLAVLFFLPLFFASTGLRTEIGLLNSAELWVMALLVLTVACVGKFGGSFLVSKLMGLTWKESAAIGILMNTRGLMELVILNIGLDLGVISSLLFTMMVIMALVTTFMTTPLLAWVYPEHEMLAEMDAGPPEAEKPYTLLVSVAFPRAGQKLMSIAAALAGRDAPYRLYVLHLIRGSERPSNFVKGRGLGEAENPLAPVLRRAKTLDLEVRPLVFFSNDPSDSIVDVAEAKGAQVILMGWHKPIFGGAFLGGTVRKVMDDSPMTVAVFIDRGLKGIRKILVPMVQGPHDQATIDLAKRIAKTYRSEITLLHVRPGTEGAGGAPKKLPAETFSDPETQGQVVFKVSSVESPVDAVLEEAKKGYDLVVIGLAEEFELETRVFGLRAERIAELCPASMLIVRGGNDAIPKNPARRG